MTYRHQLFVKHIGQITVRAFVEYDDDADASWMDKATQRQAQTEGWEAFGTIVEVDRNGYTIGRDAMWGSFVSEGADDPYLYSVARAQVGPEALAAARRTIGG